MVNDRFPVPSTDDDVNFRYPNGPLGPGAQQTMIGGTHHVSTRLTPEQALTGAYTPLNGDDMPPCPPGRGDYLPKN